MSERERKARDLRRRAVIEELEQVRRLRDRVGAQRYRRARQRQVQRLTRLLG
jgi:hypothetical protein